MVSNLNDEHAGAWAAGKDFATAARRHIRARWALLAMEGREAGRWAGSLAVLGVAIAVSLLVAVLCIAVAVAFAIAWLCKVMAGAWVLIMAGTGGIFVLLAVGLGLVIKGRIRKPVFCATREEIKKDFA